MTVKYTYAISNHFKSFYMIMIVFLILFIPSNINGQILKGRILSRETKKGIGFVNIGIINRNIGTVTDENGSYSLNLSGIDVSDSIKISMIGYKNRTLSIGYLLSESIDTTFLDPYNYLLKEVTVTFKRVKKITLGIPIPEGDLQVGFAYYLHNLGAEIAINVNVDERVKLNDINLNIRSCSFDSVIYRLNIYKFVNKSEFQNILTEPIYISFSKNDIINPIKYDLRKYSIVISGNILIALQLVKDMGYGEIIFRAENISDTYNRKSVFDSWRKVPGVIGLYLNGQIIK
jgi:hypothetical protein